MAWLKRLATAVQTKDDDALAKLIDEAPELPSDGMTSIPGATININVPSQATALPTAERTTVDDTPDNPEKRQRITPCRNGLKNLWIRYQRV